LNAGPQALEDQNPIQSAADIMTRDQAMANHIRLVLEYTGGQVAGSLGAADHIENRLFRRSDRLLNVSDSTRWIGDMYRLYLGAKRDGINYNLPYISDAFNEKEKEMFDPVYMRKLFDLGYEMAKNGYPWAKAPPGREYTYTTR
jgi:hypothetical protein